MGRFYKDVTIEINFDEYVFTEWKREKMILPPNLIFNITIGRDSFLFIRLTEILRFCLTSNDCLSPVILFVISKETHFTPSLSKI